MLIVTVLVVAVAGSVSAVILTQNTTTMPAVTGIAATCSFNLHVTRLCFRQCLRSTSYQLALLMNNRSDEFRHCYDSI